MINYFLKNILKMLSKFLLKHIHPRGEVHKQYTNYLKWSFLSNIVIGVESTICTHSVLSSINCADTATVVSTNYIGRNIIGQLGSLAFLSKVAHVDKNPYKISKYLIGFQQVSAFLECITPIVSLKYFVLLGGGANILRNISFTGFGAINAKVIRKLAKEQTVGEIYVKLTVFNTIGTSIGMVLGLLITNYIPNHSARLLLIPIITFLRMYTFNKSIEGLIT
jgi:hypothetical protein